VIANYSFDHHHVPFINIKQIFNTLHYNIIKALALFIKPLGAYLKINLFMKDINLPGLNIYNPAVGGKPVFDKIIRLIQAGQIFSSLKNRRRNFFAEF